MEDLICQLEECGYQGRIVAIEHLPDLQEGIEAHRKQGLLDEELYQTYLSGLSFCRPDDLPDARSIIVVAVPQPQLRVTFIWRGSPVSATVPPTYLYGRASDKKIERLLAEILAPMGYRVVQARVPEKLLTVRSGLGEYGRNNVTFVPGMGSFHRPVAFFSDLPCPEDNWRELRTMERCENCIACLRACPTGAIPSDRFLLRAERCLTYLNEKPSRVPFPAWVDPAWHNCLVGCMHCQRVCPENKVARDWIEEGPSFSEEETVLLLESTPLDQLPTPTVQKIEASELIDYLGELPRNLGALLETA
jgi:epoxyqueuosine reductase